MRKNILSVVSIIGLSSVFLLGAAAPAAAFSDITPYTIGSSTSTTPYITVVNPGFMGIGTQVPATALEIDGSNPAITIKKNLTGQYWQMRNGGTSSGSTAFDIYNLNTKKSLLYLTSDGNLTVGSSTSNPNSRLYVWGGVTGANIDARGDKAVYGGDQATIELEGWDYDENPNSALLQYYGPLGLGSTMGFPNNKLGHLQFTDGSVGLIHTTNSAPLVFGTMNAERMRIDGSGKVGIGTNAPQSLFQVSAGAAATTTISIGQLNAAGSKSCVNMNSAAGSPMSFYFDANGAMVVEQNYCK